ncbi:MAG: outer membrane protein assembly factor BamA [Candidatus Eisenbacteria bacterium]|nr:outer membrane protein assembly factor BamA [Candidatus Eisenbacteria bacterium]
MRSTSGFASRSGRRGTRERDNSSRLALLLGAAILCATAVAASFPCPAAGRTRSYTAHRKALARELGPLVDEIEFVGNRTFDSSELFRYMKTAESGFLSPARYSRAVLDDDLENLERFYMTRGFLEADAALEDVAVSPDSTEIDILVSVYEGPRWMVGEITYDGNVALPDEKLAEVTTLEEGGPLLSNELAPDRRSILEAYARESYLDARVAQTTGRDPERRTVSVRYDITERERAVIESVSVVGDEKTREYVIRREFEFSVGDHFDPEAIGETQAEIYRTGLFHSVWIEPAREDTGRPRKELLVRVGERPSGHYEFELGYAALDGPEAGASIINRNVQGQAIELSGEGSYSTYKRYVRGSVGDPYFTGRPVTGKLGLSYEWKDEESFTSESSSARFTLSKRFGRAVTVEGGYEFARTVVLEATERSVEEGTNYTSKVSGAVSYDTRDDILNPRRGMLARVASDLASSQLGGTNDFVRYELEWRGYRRVLPGTIACLAARTGWVNPHGDGADVPVNERYFAGGDGSVRGFERNSLSPLDADGDPKGGRALVELRGELRFPVRKELRGVAFVDSGDAFDDFEAVRSAGLEAGAGAGLRLGTPVGVLRFDVAWPVTEAGPAKYYFGVGQAF